MYSNIVSRSTDIVINKKKSEALLRLQNQQTFIHLSPN